MANSEEVLRFAWLWLRTTAWEEEIPSLDRGISLFYLAYQLILSIQPRDKVAAALSSSNFRHGDIEGLARDLSETYDRLPSVPAEVHL